MDDKEIYKEFGLTDEMIENISTNKEIEKLADNFYGSFNYKICITGCLYRDCEFYNENAFSGYCSNPGECKINKEPKK